MFQPLFLLLFSFLAQAQPLTVANEACRCEPVADDPFERPVALTSGSLAGSCVDSCRFRATQILRSDDRIELANVLHNGRFQIASVDPSSAYEIDALFEGFLPAVNHVALRVRFRSPVKLRSQREANSAFDAETNDLVISVEAALTPAGTFHFFPAESGAYLLVYRVVTIEESKRWGIRTLGHAIRQYRLNVEPSAIPAFVRLALANSQDLSFGSPYYLFSANCATTAFDMLDQVTGAAPLSGVAWAQRAWPIDGPYGTYRYLVGAGMISATLPNLEKE